MEKWLQVPAVPRAKENKSKNNTRDSTHLTVENLHVRCCIHIKNKITNKEKKTKKQNIYYNVTCGTRRSSDEN